MANSTNTSKQKAIKQARQENAAESIKGIAGDTMKVLRDDLLKESAKDFMAQLLGMQPARKVSGEIQPGKEVRMENVMSGKQEEIDKMQKHIAFERRILDEEKAIIDRKGRELSLQLHAITQEIQSIVKVTPKLAQQVEFAKVGAPINPGNYHLIFFEKLLSYIKDFRKNIEKASIWLEGANKRASKKGVFWAQYDKKNGS